MLAAKTSSYNFTTEILTKRRAASEKGQLAWTAGCAVGNFVSEYLSTNSYLHEDGGKESTSSPETTITKHASTTHKSPPMRPRTHFITTHREPLLPSISSHRSRFSDKLYPRVLAYYLVAVD